MKAAKDKWEGCYDRNDNIFGEETDKTGVVGSAPQRHNHSRGQSSEVPRRSISGLTSCSKFLRKVTRTAMACSWVSSGILKKKWERPFSEGVWPYLDPWGSVRLRTASTHRNFPGKFGPHSELIFFLIKKEQVVASNELLPNPFVSAEMLKACALTGLHLLAAEGEDG